MGGTSGSKPDSRTRSRVELFTVSEQLPGPARFGKGCVMESVAVRAAEFVRTPLNAVQDLRNAFARFEEAYDATLVEMDWPEEGKEWRFSQNGRVNLTDMRVCERLKFVFRCVQLARNREPELFGILDPWGYEQPGFVSWMSMFMQEANGKETFCLDGYPLWSLGQQLELFEFEILTRNQSVSPSPPNAEPPHDTGAAPKNSPTEILPDGPDEPLPFAERPTLHGNPPSVNALMIELMQKHGQEECLGWSVRRWCLELEPGRGKKPAESTIHGTPTYQLLKGLNDQKKVAMVERQTAKDEKGKRRSNRY